MALIPQESINELQTRIKHEEFNAKQYDAMKFWLNLNGYVNASKLWGKYAEDERSHKQWAVDYLLDLNILPLEPAEDQPQTEFKGLPNIIALTMARELQTTKEVEDLTDLCLSLKDYKTLGLAQKYVAEQVEELAKVQLLIDQLNAFGADQIAMRLLDNWIGENLLG